MLVINRAALSLLFLLCGDGRAFSTLRQGRMIFTSCSSSNGNDEVAPFRRARDSMADLPDGVAVVLLPASRVLMPGAMRSFHFYDSNLLNALDYARGRDGKLVILGYDEKSRKLKYGPGTLASVGVVENAMRENKFAEKSESKIVQVTGEGPVTVAEVLQFEPFMLATIEGKGTGGGCEDRDDGETREVKEAELSRAADLVALCSNCMELRKSMQLPLLKPSSDGRPDDTESDPSVLEVSSRDSLLLVAWMCAQHCLPEFRAGALALGEDTSALLTYVEENLEETKRTLLAMKALQQLSNGPTASSP